MSETCGKDACALSAGRGDGKGHVTHTSQLDKEVLTEGRSEKSLQLGLLMPGIRPHTPVVCRDSLSLLDGL